MSQATTTKTPRRFARAVGTASPTDLVVRPRTRADRIGLGPAGLRMKPGELSLDVDLGRLPTQYLDTPTQGRNDEAPFLSGFSLPLAKLLEKADPWRPKKQSEPNAPAGGTDG
jgi:hypothetical protein